MAVATPEVMRAGLLDISTEATAALALVVRRSPRAARGVLLDLGVDAMGSYVSGSAALAAEWYDELREESRPGMPYATLVPEWQREEKFSRALVWATEPLELDDPDLIEALNRLGSAVEYETFDAFSQSMDANVRDDAEALGWSRNANYGACKFCLMLAGRGSLYRKQETARFAAHTNCQCTYVPVFRNSEHGPEATVIQYQASQRYRTKAERDANNARVRSYLNEHYPDAPG